jgi:saccharopine dehydrogenase-like NADP-dependent oxidoreductase
MPHAIIVGAGNMGTAIAYAMSRLGFDITVVENKSAERVARLAEEGKINNFKWCSVPQNAGHADVLISAATYLANPAMAQYALENNIPYCDLGGDPSTSGLIHDMAVKHYLEANKVSVFTDLGLAPGLVNILAEKLITLRTEKVVMRVGGLPAEPMSNSLNYGLTWSSEGLRNEYSGDCCVIRDGEFATVKALSEIDEVDFVGVGKLESFHTKGGSSHSIDTLRNFGVKHVEYKTMRFKGHAKLIDFMLNECKLSNEIFDETMRKVCPVITNDQVLIDIEINGQSVKQIRVMHDENWTAMQKATAFPTAAVASLLAQRELTNKPILEYIDIPLNRMEEQLQRIGGFPSIV